MTAADSWMQQPPYGWTVSQSVLQAWLNNPGLCYGLALVPIEPNENNQCFALNGMHWAPQQMPKLVVDIITWVRRLERVAGHGGLMRAEHQGNEAAATPCFGIESARCQGMVSG